jgi:hypothetical protein
MMRVYAVMIKDAYSRRWIDSLWSERGAKGLDSGAEARASELRTTIEAMDAKHVVWVVDMKIQDAVLGRPMKSLDEPEGMVPEVKE